MMNKREKKTFQIVSSAGKIRNRTQVTRENYKQPLSISVSRNRRDFYDESFSVRLFSFNVRKCNEAFTSSRVVSKRWVCTHACSGCSRESSLGASERKYMYPCRP